MSLLKSRSRLRSVKSLNSILSALQIVTVVRMKKIRAKYAVSQGYLESVKKVLAGRVSLAKKKEKLVVVITSNRGLCGNFNSQVLTKAKEFILTHPPSPSLIKRGGGELYTGGGEFAIIALGKRGIEYFRKRPHLGEVILTEAEALEHFSSSKVAELWQKIEALNCEVHVVYNNYKSTMVQVPTVTRLFPLPEELEQQTEPQDFILEPEPAKLTEALLTHYLAVRFFQLMLASQMGELAARMMVLKGAVDNSKELVEDLVISINKMRQAVITRDLAEIIGSAEALRGPR